MQVTNNRMIFCRTLVCATQTILVFDSKENLSGLRHQYNPPAVVGVPAGSTVLINEQKNMQVTNNCMMFCLTFVCATQMISVFDSNEQLSVLRHQYNHSRCWCSCRLCSFDNEQKNMQVTNSCMMFCLTFVCATQTILVSDSNKQLSVLRHQYNRTVPAVVGVPAGSAVLIMNRRTCRSPTTV